MSPENAALRFNDHFRAIVEQNADGTALIAADGTIHYASPALARLLGTTADDLRERSLVAFLPAADSAAVLAAVAGLIDRPGETVTIEHQIVREDGGTRWCETRIGNLQHEPSMGALVASVRDVTERKRSEDDLAHLAAIIDGSQDAILSRTLDGTITSWNPAAERIFGYTNEEAIGRSAAILIPPDRVDELPYLSERIARGERIAHFETIRQRKDGTPIAMSISLSPIVDQTAQVIGVSTIARDLTDRTRAEAALRESETRLQAIMDNTSAVIYVKDLAGCYVLVNRQYERLFHITREEVVGKSDLELFPRELAEAFRSNDRLVLAAGEPLELEEIAPHDDGLHTYISIKFPLRDAAGVPVALCGISTDITERKRTEEAQRFLAEASAILASSLDEATTLDSVARLVVPRLADWCAVHVIEEDGAVVFLTAAHADPARVAWLDELRARYPFNPDAAEGVARVLRTGRAALYPEIPVAQIESAARDSDEFALLRKIGLASAMFVPMIARERILGVLSYLSTESGRRFSAADLELAEDLARRAALAVENARLYRRSQEAVRARDEFLSIAAHELRTPISSVGGFADLLVRFGEQGQLTAEQIDRYPRRIAEASVRLARLVGDLLDVSRLRLGRLPLRPVALDLAPFVGDVAGRFRDRLGDRAGLSIVVDALPCTVSADPDRLEQVLGNLLDNAAKYSPDGGEIRLTLRPDGDGALVTIRDEGIGLPPGAEEAIFEPFGRAHNAAAQSYPGLGLGLSISRGIVDQHGGRIWVESAGEGAGTAVHVWLPCLAVSPQDEPVTLSSAV